ncbi:mediator complex subunit MED14-domain-containing protein [Protomyces lactucae-debilis]|uniref:Mediator of RNA polymerase II transcription subunit 14 n=1 Tax=Protomyces lactucae-debilis TaxID=2754530 RepID=A0A1Y2F0P1_PROLT|nr:mediator complex subunit MED14-domain-containing protein [Protomyces lactucae-debilis]ORY77419.1 mediator complex subunit MED14-domain-containing protein [Protomyces lactucae-debilis]
MSEDKMDVSPLANHHPDAASSTTEAPTHKIAKLPDPPAIPHINERFIPLSHVVSALVRTAMLELRQLRDVTADLSDQKRKRRIIDYCSAFKTEFVKVLVLVDWAKNADDVHRAIDVKAWLQGQRNCFDNLYGSLRWDVLRSMEHAKLRNPDLLGAVDVLKTGSFPRLRQSELARQYRVLPPIKPRQVLRTMQAMNALISLRLQLYETLPWPMRHFTISSGRARFHIPDAFTADLSFASEDVELPALTWFLIDFSFASETPDTVKLEIEAMSNALMSQAQAEGRPQLVSLYNRLHSLLVLYKLERLFNQFSALDPRQRKLVDVKYASAERKMVVGYWLDQRASEGHARNSFTVSIAAVSVPAKARLLKSQRHSLDYNTDALVAYRRDDSGEDRPLLFTLDGLDASSLLESVLAMHQTQNLTALKDALRLRCTLNDAELVVRLSDTNQLCISVDASNGQFVVYRLGEPGPIRIQNTQIATLRRQINGSSNVGEQAAFVRQYQLAVARHELEQAATLACWTLFRFTQVAFERDDFQRAFSGAQAKDCLFLTRAQEGWQETSVERSAWFVVATFARVGPDVSVQLYLAECQVDEERGWYIQWTEALEPVKAEVSFDWQRIWRFSTARILLLQLSRALTERGCQYRFVAGKSPWRTIRVPALRVAAKDMPPGRRIWSGDATWTLTRVGEECELSLQAQKLLATQLDLGALESNGQLNITRRVTVRDGIAAAVSEVLDVWRQVEDRICRIESISRLSGRLDIQASSLASLVLSYGSYQLNIGEDTLALSTAMPGLLNPHERVLPLLQALYTRYASILVLGETLLATLPALEAFTLLEQQTFLSPSCYIVTRSLSLYRIYYPTRQAGLEIQLRPQPSESLMSTSGTSLEGAAEWLLLDLASLGVEASVRFCSVAHKVGFKAMTLASHATNVFGLQIPADAQGDASLSSTLMRIHDGIMQIPERNAAVFGIPQESPRKKGPAARRVSKASTTASKKPGVTNGREVIEL